MCVGYAEIGIKGINALSTIIHAKVYKDYEIKKKIKKTNFFNYTVTQ